MNRIADFNDEDLYTLRREVRREYEIFRARGLALDMTRGKPAPEQLDLANDLLALPGTRDHFTEAGDDARNYGGLQGLPEARALFSNILGAPVDRLVASGNSSLAVMQDCVVWALLKGVPGSTAPWSQTPAPSFICPVPGYDRHFAICEEYGIRMLPVPMTGQGPDMDTVERLVADPAVKGMWCVPKYSNPTGEVYSEETVQRLAAMPTGAPDFRVFWDNAYAVHHLTECRHEIANILDLCERAGNPDRTFVFASTSKVTLAGAGLAFFASSAANVRWYLGRAAKRTIGPDKLNQLRHVRFLKNEEGLRRHMDAHRRFGVALGRNWRRTVVEAGRGLLRYRECNGWHSQARRGTCSKHRPGAHPSRGHLAPWARSVRPHVAPRPNISAFEGCPRRIRRDRHLHPDGSR
jgi:DNA-binding transcriptional MocR family regulator